MTAPASSHAAATNTSSNIPIPGAWPPEVRERYQPIRTLGKGGFASVILAKDLQHSHSNIKDKDNQYVAMKVVGGAGGKGGAITAFESTYAHREIDILKEISHPNIMTVIDYWESSGTSDGSDGDKGKVAPSGKSPYSVTMALSYSKGPTLESLLQYGGALSTTFARTVISQLVDALACLHYHAVIHRDIKPDNIIITGAFKNQDSIWDTEAEDGDDDKKNLGQEQEQVKTNDNSIINSNDDDDTSLKRFDTNLSSGTILADKEARHWTALRQRWKVTLIDFGFARALTPEDVASPSLDLKNENTKAAFSTRNLAAAAAAAVDSSTHSTKNSSTRRRRSAGLNLSRHNSNTIDDGNNDNNSSIHADVSVSSSTHRRRKMYARNSVDSSIGHSFSHLIQRRMSALGNRNFAAPEIVNHVKHETKTTKTDTSGDGDAGTDITQTVSEYVAEYGLMVDAYSLGHTIRYCMTGVPPYMTVEEAIQDENSLCSMLCGNGRGGKNKKTGLRSPHYRRVSESPAEVQRLITKLCEPNEKSRTSVRKVRRTYPWIYQTFSEQENDSSPWFSESSANVEYLKCALSSKSKKRQD